MQLKQRNVCVSVLESGFRLKASHMLGFKKHQKSEVSSG